MVSSFLRLITSSTASGLLATCIRAFLDSIEFESIGEPLHRSAKLKFWNRELQPVVYGPICASGAISNFPHLALDRTWSGATRNSFPRWPLNRSWSSNSFSGCSSSHHQLAERTCTESQWACTDGVRAHGRSTRRSLMKYFQYSRI